VDQASILGRNSGYDPYLEAETLWDAPLGIKRIVRLSTCVEETTESTLFGVTYVADFYWHFAYSWLRVIKGIAHAEGSQLFVVDVMRSRDGGIDEGKLF
jgi:hypothetical protein